MAIASKALRRSARSWASRRAHPGAIPTAEAGTFARETRRTTVVRLALALALVALLAVAVWRAFLLDPARAAFLPRGESTILVIDLSKSVYVDSYRGISAMIDELAASDASVGLVAFSDSAYELLPSGSRASDLRPLVRFFTPRPGRASDLDPESRFPVSPWSDSFSSGTRISTGIALARESLEREGVRRGAILLMSDLESPSDDLPELTQQLAALRRQARIRLRIVPLGPPGDGRRLFERFLGKDAFVDPERVEFVRSPRRDTEPEGRFPTSLLLAGGLLILLLAANELWCNPLLVPREVRT